MVVNKLAAVNSKAMQIQKLCIASNCIIEINADTLEL